MEEFKENKPSERKRIKMISFPQLEQTVKMWFDQNNQRNNVTISGFDIIQQAIIYAVFLDYTDFKASNGRLEKFIKRNNISLKATWGEVDQDVVKNWINNILPDQIKDYHPKDIFNEDETSKYFRALPVKHILIKVSRKYFFCLCYYLYILYILIFKHKIIKEWQPIRIKYQKRDNAFILTHVP